jgi:hypothetical protein
MGNLSMKWHNMDSLLDNKNSKKDGKKEPPSNNLSKGQDCHVLGSPIAAEFEYFFQQHKSTNVKEMDGQPT